MRGAIAVCRSCQELRKIARRGICWRCYDNPAVRPQYARQIAFDGLGLDEGHRKPCEPTPHAPGTPGKLLVLIDRAARGEELFHEDDAKGVRRRSPATPSLFHVA